MQAHSWYRIGNEDQVPSPALLVFPERIQANLQQMLREFGGPDKLRPHVKTHKMAHVVELKLQAGIRKFKTSTICETEMTALAGGRDILLAVQPVGPNIHRLARLARLYPQTQFSAIVDSLNIAKQLAQAAEQHQVTLGLFLDLNVGMNRTGLPPGEAAIALYRQLCGYEGIIPRGFHAYDGHLYDSNLPNLKARVDEAFAPVWAMRNQLLGEGLAVPTVVAGGSPTSKLLAPTEGVEVSAGTTVLWDFGQPLLSPDLTFLHAAVLLCRVISKPTENRLCIDLGHKAVAAEMPHPRVQWLGLEGAVAVTHSEEHLVIETPQSAQYSVGDVLYGIPRHVCPTVALHDHAWCVVKGQATETWPVTARARRLTV